MTLPIKVFHHLRFFIKTALYLLPFKFGFYRELHRNIDTNYLLERDQDPIRKKHFSKGGWKQNREGAFHYRDYDSYEEYQTHQKQKFNEMIKTKGGFSNREILRYRIKFYQRFRYLPGFLPPSAIILCAGARQGTEVEVLHDLGFYNAIGIDLNPGPNNKFVRVGDFMNIDYPDSSIDMIYSNCLDHAFNLEQFFHEHIRVLKLNGLALYDIALQEGVGGGPFESVEWDSEEELFLMMLKYFSRVLKVDSDKLWKWILLQKTTRSA